MSAQCPANSILYNKTLCACAPGFLFNVGTKNCNAFITSNNDWVLNSGVDYSIVIPETFFSFDQLKRLTQSQAVFLEAAAVLLVFWLVFCGVVRFGSLGDGRTSWFQLRWWISRLDICFATRHWLEDQKVVKKRKTELGGTFSIASWILFLGLLSALLYQIISKRSVEVHNIRATNAPDLVSFVNDLEFNITTISTMSCSQLRNLGTVGLGNPGSIDYRVSPLSAFSDYSCQNTSRGPTISLVCNNCPLTRDNAYISWQFVDILGQPATAVGFDFNLTARSPVKKKHVSLVSGTVKNGTDMDNSPVTFRGNDTNILKFNLFPRLYQNKHNLKLIQPLFHEFLPGSSIRNANDLQVSLQSSSNGMINTTIVINFLSDYIVEIDSQNIFGPVSFLADLGGLYCISMGIFFYLLVQCEYRIKRLRNEDRVFRDLRRRCRAQDNWDKLRKYVKFTWGPRSLLDEDEYFSNSGCCTGGDPFKRNESFQKRSLRESNLLSVSFDKTTSSESPVKKYVKEPVKSVNVFVPSIHTDDYIPPPPTVPEFNGNSSVNLSDIQKSLQNLYEYNALLREKLVNTQTTLRALTMKKQPSATFEVES
ncbi:hypothetical protein RND81_04G228700 [Saponaria officinalis]|uniref:Transmembrane protein n=1 Tax=Saponaria officinalis TaxID=3572 RepID=A0AAW1LGR6_SAPOF